MIETLLIVWLIGFVAFGGLGGMIVNNFLILPIPSKTLLLLLLALIFWPITLGYICVTTLWDRLTFKPLPEDSGKVVEAKKPKK